MFFIEQKGIQIQDIIHCPVQFCALLELDAPYYITLYKHNSNTVKLIYHLLDLKLKFMYIL